jgi:hypothetical protein
MATQNNSRTSDLGTILTTGSSGFTVRKRTGVGLFFHFFLLACMVILGVALLVYYQSPKGCALAIAIGLSFAIIAQNLEKLKKHKESIEFMNALFSSALGAGWKFCCIVKSTGDIVFYNRPFQSIFPAYIKQNNRTLESLLTLYNVPQADRDIINGFIFSTSAGSISITLPAVESAESQTFAVHIEPIERPTGFFLIRGK